MHKKMVAMLPIVAFSAGIGIYSGPVRAQQSPPSGQNDLEEIVVTAQRRSELLERTPLTVTALNSESLERQNIVTEQDLQFAVPGLLVNAGWDSNQLNYSIRGQSIDQFTGSAVAVQPYLNNIPNTTIVASTFYDLDSIQVLKGPQGTLFGTNSTGGAVLYTSAAPVDRFEGYALTRLGNYNDHEFEGAVNLPLDGDKAILRIAGTTANREGFTLNDLNGQKLGNLDRDSARISLLLHPIDALTNTLVVEYDKSTGIGIPGVLYSAYPTSLYIPANFNALGAELGVPNAWAAFVAAHPKVDPNGILSFLATQQSRGPFVVSLDAPEEDNSHSEFVSNTTSFDINPDIQIKNILGYIKTQHYQSLDEDGSPFPILHTIFNGTSRQWTDELQLLGKAFGGDLSYVAGVFYLDHLDKDTNAGYFVDLAPVIPVTYQNFIDSLQSKSIAGYGQATYDLGRITGIHGLSVIAGVRYTSQKEIINQLPGSVLYDTPGTDTNSEQVTTNKPSYTFGVQEQLNDDLLLYAVTRKSFRSGGFNIYAAQYPGNASVGGNGFDPEVAKDVEIGEKFQGKIAGVPIRTNLAIYNQWIYDLQRAQDAVDPITGAHAGFTANVPEAQVRGFEMDTTIQPVSWFDFGVTLAYTHAAFTKSVSTLFNQPIVYGPYSDTPEWSGSVFAEFRQPLPNSIGTLIIRGDTFAQSKFYFSSTDYTINPQTELPGYGITNLQLGLENIENSGVSVVAYTKNAFNRIYFTGGIPQGSSLEYNMSSPGAPRTYFVEARYKF